MSDKIFNRTFDYWYYYIKQKYETERKKEKIKFIFSI